MSRLVKQIIYGAFYLLITGLLIIVFFQIPVTVKSNCTDLIKNGNETGVDCGGSCPICVLNEMASLQKIGEVKLFSLNSGQIALLAQIANQNPKLVASEFSYRFLIYDNFNNLIQAINGTETLYASESKYIYAANIAPLGAEIGWVNLEILNTNWSDVQDSLRPSLEIENFKTEADKEIIKISGTVFNQSPILAEEVKITGLISDRLGVELFAAQTLISKIGGSDRGVFTIYFPRDKALTDRVDPAATEIFISHAL